MLIVPHPRPDRVRQGLQVLTLLGALVAGLAAGLGWRAQRSTAEIRQSLSAPTQPLLSDAPSALLPAADADAADRLVADLHRLAQAHQLTIRDYTLEPASASGREDAMHLVQLRGNLQLQGRYADVKQLVREAAARAPGFTITRLELSRSAGADDMAPRLDASLAFVLLRLPKVRAASQPQ